MTFKQKLYSACLSLIKNKIDFSLELLKELSNGAEEATKSSAGDKHETGRAMVQLEQEKIGNQLMELENMYNELQKLNGQISNQKIAKGTLIQTNEGYFYISVGLGKVLVENETVFALSPHSPLGMQFMGLENGAKTSFNGKKYSILRID